MAKIGLVQINNSFSGQNYFPYSVAILQAYARSHLKTPGDFEFLPPVYSRIKVDDAVKLLSGADLAAFSVYVWNIEISLEVARRLKAARPETVILFGGPQVPDHSEEFLRRRRFIDLACHGEGEQVFAAALERLDSRDWGGLKSASFLEGGRYVLNERFERLRDLAAVPSPYLAGVFDPVMRANPKEAWIGLWETNRGCPFACTYCDWGSATAAKVTRFDLDRLFQELEWFAEHRVEFVFCADANFGMLPRDLEIVRRAARVKKAHGYPRALSVQNTKNATERAYQVQKELSDAGMNKGVTISVQSMDPATLKSIKRDNISLETYQTLQRRFASQGVKTYSDIILGMPGETYDTLADGVGRIIAGGQHNRIQFNNLSILPNAEMGDPAYRKRFGMATVRSKIINFHGSREDDEIPEYQELVIATAAMPKADWLRTRTFGWWAGLLHFGKLLQIPFILLHESCGVSYRELIELFSEAPEEGFPVTYGIRVSFWEKAKAIQGGGVEYFEGGALKIWWPADELVLIELCMEERLGAFYAEARELIERFLAARKTKPPAGALAEALTLNRKLIKLPNQTDDIEVKLEYNTLEYYRAAVVLAPVPLKYEPGVYQVDRTSKTWASWEDWCREVVWWGNKQGAYLYGIAAAPDKELAGHY